MTYESFRTGLTFSDVRQMLKEEQAIARMRAEVGQGEYMFVTRHTVMGRWGELKRSMYAAYLKGTGNEPSR